MKPGKRILIILFWLCIWQLAAIAVNQPLILAGPIETLSALVRIITTLSSWLVIGNTALKIVAGFLCALLLGILLGAFAYKSRIVKEMLAPVVTTIKSIPVASFVVLLLAWLSSADISIFIAAVVTFPIVYFDILDSLVNTDKHILNMAAVFKASVYKKIRYIYCPQLLKRLNNTARISIGMSIRAGVAAELIGVPAKTIGEQIYKTKLYFDITGLFAWTIIIVLLCFISEKAVIFLCNAIARRLADDKG